MVPINGMDKMTVVSVIRDTREKSVKHVSVKTFYKNQFKARSLVIQIPDQEKTSPYNINTISSRQVMGIKKNLYGGNII